MLKLVLVGHSVDILMQCLPFGQLRNQINISTGSVSELLLDEDHLVLHWKSKSFSAFIFSSCWSIRT